MSESLEERVTRLEGQLADTTDEDVADVLQGGSWFMYFVLPSAANQRCDLEVARSGDLLELSLRINGAYRTWRHHVGLRPREQ